MATKPRDATATAHTESRIRLDDIHMSYRTVKGWNHVLRGVTLDIPRHRSLGIFGRNGSGKSTLINILAGLLEPDQGAIDLNGLRISWPIGRPAFHAKLTARNNIKFVCRVMGADIPSVVEAVEDFAELGEYMDMPLTTYSSGMKSRLNFALSMAVDCDCLLVDEGFNAGDARFTQKMHDRFDQLRADKNMICVSHNGNIIQRFCDYAGILQDGKIEVYEDIDEAIEIYRHL